MLGRPQLDVLVPVARGVAEEIAVPVVELALLIEIGQRVGTVGTIGLIMGTGIVGASLARQQGISTLARLRADLDAGRWPAEPIVDGVLILVAAAVLITPGVLTDLAGFLCLVPACRRLLRRYLHQRFEGTMRRGGAGVRGAFVSAGEPSRRSRMKNAPRADPPIPAANPAESPDIAAEERGRRQRESRRACR